MSRSHTLERQQWIPRSRDEVFTFFANARNLEQLTPPWLGFRILTPSPIQMADGSRIDYTIRLGGVPVRWRTRIREWHAPIGFVDEQERGPYASWVHTHQFDELDGGTLMSDRVQYGLRFGPIGGLAHLVAVRSTVSAIFDYRFDRIREIFGSNLPASSRSSEQLDWRDRSNAVNAASHRASRPTNGRPPAQRGSS